MYIMDVDIIKIILHAMGDVYVRFLLQRYTHV